MLPIIAIVISGLTLVWTIYWSIQQRRLATRPQLTVRSTWAFLASGPELSDLCVSTTATNTGLAPVTLASCTMLVHGHEQSRVAVVDWVTQNPRSLPARLEPGDHWTGMAHAASIKATLDHNLGPRERWWIRPIVGDPTGRAYKAKLGGRGWNRLRLRHRHWLALN